MFNLKIQKRDEKISDVIEKYKYYKQKLNNYMKLYQGYLNGVIEEQSFNKFWIVYLSEINFL